MAKGYFYAVKDYLGYYVGSFETKAAAEKHASKKAFGKSQVIKIHRNKK